MPNTEKITINMSAVDLGKIELLVQEGLYSNRTDFIRTAIRAQIERHNLEVQQSVARHSYGIGVFAYSRKDLEAWKISGKKIDITVVGLLRLADDISPALAAEVIRSLQVRGIFNASDAVKAVLAERMN